MVEEMEKERGKDQVVIESYLIAVESNVEERKHSGRVLRDLQNENGNLSKTVEALTEMVCNL